jgi:hypothetical protein
VAERLNAAVSKTVSGLIGLTRVRIPPPPLPSPSVGEPDFPYLGELGVPGGSTSSGRFNR